MVGWDLFYGEKNPKLNLFTAVPMFPVGSLIGCIPFMPQFPGPDSASTPLTPVDPHQVRASGPSRRTSGRG